jgi:hypothetical protein
MLEAEHESSTPFKPKPVTEYNHAPTLFASHLTTYFLTSLRFVLMLLSHDEHKIIKYLIGCLCSNIHGGTTEVPWSASRPSGVPEK